MNSAVLVLSGVSVLQGMSVCAAVCRVFGTILAEVPLVATRAAARRQGHARVLMSGLETFFSHVRRSLDSTPECMSACASPVNANRVQRVLD
jgi:hypothetical protein